MNSAEITAVLTGMAGIITAVVTALKMRDEINQKDIELEAVRKELVKERQNRVECLLKMAKLEGTVATLTSALKNMGIL
jgi:hypothetical protein